MTLVKGDHVRLHAVDRESDPSCIELPIGVVLRVEKDPNGNMDDCLVRLDRTKHEIWWWASQLEVIRGA